MIREIVRKIRQFGAHAPLSLLLATLVACEESVITVETTVMGGGPLGGIVRLINDVTGETLDITGEGSLDFAQTSTGYTVRVESAPPGYTCQVSKGVRPTFPGDEPGQVSRTVKLRCAPDGLDTDGDGLPDGQELALGTNPKLLDTDGDGYDDEYELARFDGHPSIEPEDDLASFNPRVADMPRLEVELVEAPDIEVVATETNYGDRTIGTSHDQSATQGESSTFGGEASRVISFGHTIKAATELTLGQSLEISLEPSLTTTWEAKVSAGIENSTTNTSGSTYSWSDTQRQENGVVYGQYRDETAGASVTVEGATLTVRVRAHNPSRIAYDLENLTLSAYHFDPKNPGDIEFVALPLAYGAGAFPTTNLLPGDASAVWTFQGAIELDDAEALLRSSRQIAITPATLLMVGERPDGSIGSLLIEGTDIENETATVAIDFGAAGGGVQDRFRVAIDNGDGSDWISAADALEQALGFATLHQWGTWRFEDGGPGQRTDWGLLRLAHPDPAQALDFAMSTDENRYWMVTHTGKPGFGGEPGPTQAYTILTEAYDLHHIELRKGDTLSLVLVGDRDRDGLPDRTELELGTDQLLRDSDGDGLDDGTELWGYTLACPALPGGVLDVPSSNPLLPDTDGDGANDDADCDPVQIVDLVADCGPDSDLIVNQSVVCSASFGGAAAERCDWTLRDGEGAIVHQESSPFCDDLVYPTDRVQTLDVELIVTAATPPFAPSSTTTRLDVWNGDERIFVDREKGDAIASGAANDPFETITGGLNHAALYGGDLYVMTRPASPYPAVLSVPEGTSLFGGYEDASDPSDPEAAPVWVRKPRSHKTPLPIVKDGVAVRFPTLPATGVVTFSGFDLDASGSVTQDVIALEVGRGQSGMQGIFELEDNEIKSGDGASASGNGSPGRSSYGVYAANLDTLRLAGNRIEAGRGGAGALRPEVTYASSGARGGAATSTDWGLGGWGPGGRGGHAGWSGQNGLTGANGCNGEAGTQGGRGGAPGSGGAQKRYSWDARPNGTDGSVGLPGNDAAPAPAPDLTNALFTSSDGYDGGCGGDGGGGGGGGTDTSFGPHDFGSGGGAGGDGGLGGKGGGGGGASIALAVSNVDTVASEGDDLAAVDAGAGGHGGVPGWYGSGGLGGILPNNDYGGRGGKGGRGGMGGAGSGGHGGHSFGVLLSPSVVEAAFEGGAITFGSGGAGGTRAGTVPGGTGWNAAVMSFSPTNVSVTP